MKRALIYYTLTAILFSLVWLIGCGGGGGGGGGTVPDVPTATSTPTPALGNITVKVFESDGSTPVSEAFVAFYNYNSRAESASVPYDTKVADSNGEVTFTNVPQGACRIEFWRSENDYENNESPIGAAEGNVGTEGNLQVTAGVIAPTATPTSPPVPGATSTPTSTPVSTPHWRADVRVDDGGTSITGGPAIATDSNGNSCSVWVDSRNEENGDIYSSYRPSGGTWQGNKRVDDAGAGTWISSPDITVDGNGNFYTIWADARSGQWDIRFAYSSPGGDWSMSERVDHDTGNNSANEPAITADAYGNLYAVWADEREDSKGDIYYSYHPAGGTWSADERVDNGGASTAGCPSIAVDNNGNPCVIWEDYRNGNFDIYFSSRSSEGTWSDDVRVDNDWQTKNAYGPIIAADNSGNLYAVWRDYRNDTLDIYFCYRPSGGNWLYNQKLNTSPSTSYPDICVDVNGNVYVVWQDGYSTNYDIYYSYLPSGGAWNASEKVDHDMNDNDAEKPSIGVDDSGKVYVVWHDNRNGDSDIYFSIKE